MLFFSLKRKLSRSFYIMIIQVVEYITINRKKKALLGNAFAYTFYALDTVVI